MLRNIYVQRDKKIFQDIKHFADIITDQIGFRLVTGWLKCTDCTDCLFLTLKLYGLYGFVFKLYGLYGFLSWKIHRFFLFSLISANFS